jgi:alpha-galactosidase
MIGGDLQAADEWTISLLTNPEVLSVDQHSKNARQFIVTNDFVVWTSVPESEDGRYVALFNLSSKPLHVLKTWKELGLSSGEYKVRDLWHRRDIGKIEAIEDTLPAHGSALYKALRE